MAKQIDAAGRTGAPLSIAILDIDHFKKINDTYGHHAGDRTLQIFSQIAAETIRGADRIGRHGGEEFLLVLVGAPLDTAKEPLERTRKALTAHQWDASEAGLRVTTTIGVARHTPGETAQELIRRADMAPYLGKESGRDRLVIDPGIFQVVTAKARGAKPIRCRAPAIPRSGKRVVFALYPDSLNRRRICLVGVANRGE